MKVVQSGGVHFYKCIGSHNVSASVNAFGVCSCPPLHRDRVDSPKRDSGLANSVLGFVRLYNNNTHMKHVSNRVRVVCLHDKASSVDKNDDGI